MATNWHCLRETSAHHHSPVNLIMAGLFHTAPWWRRRPCGYDAVGLGWCGAAVACTDKDRLGMGAIKCWRQKLPAETCRQWKHAARMYPGADLRAVLWKCANNPASSVYAWCACVSYWEIRSPDPCRRSLLRDHLLHTLEGARSLGGSLITLKSQLWTLLFMNSTGFSQFLLFFYAKKDYFTVEGSPQGQSDHIHPWELCCRMS